MYHGQVLYSDYPLGISLRGPRLRPCDPGVKSGPHLSTGMYVSCPPSKCPFPFVRSTCQLCLLARDTP